ncbi:MAG: helix-hairpin-helix domain-containing protein [bacterium]|nr:helix-hairpin-helix domain-containing protein [bacterium]
MFNLTKQEQLVILFLLGVILVGFGVKQYLNSRETVTVTPALANIQSTLAGSAPNAYSGQTVIVHITGAVNNPGIYHLPFGSRLYDAITTAGDTTKQADINQLNLAEFIQDGEKIVVPFIGQAGESKSDLTQTQQWQVYAPPAGGALALPSSKSRQSGKINVNTASQSELETLPGIGPKLAQRIIQYRQEHGAFQRVEDLILVSGIGPKKMEQIKDSITVR